MGQGTAADPKRPGAIPFAMVTLPMGTHDPTIEQVLALSGVETSPPGGMAMTRRAAALACLFPGDRALVVSSGLGRQAIYYAEESGAQVTGVDPVLDHVVAANLAAARSRAAGRVRFQRGDLLRLPFRPETFDAVIGEHPASGSEDPQGVLNEMVRVLRRGGTLVLHEPTWRVPGRVSDRDELAARFGLRPFASADWVAMLERAGAAGVEAESDRWSRPEAFCKLRLDRVQDDPRDLLTQRERLRTGLRVARRFGLGGVRRALENERLVRTAVLEGKLGYGLYWAKRPAG